MRCGEAKPTIDAEDVITRVAGKPVKNLDALLAATEQITKGKDKPVPALVEFERKSEKFLTVVKVGIRELEDAGAEVKKAWLGAATQVLTRPMAEQFGLAGRTGVRLTDVFAGGNAEKADLRVGDLIVAVNGEAVAASNQEDQEVFPTLIRQCEVGAVVELTALRDGQEEKIKVELVRAPKPAREMKKHRDDNFDFTARDVAFSDTTENKWERDQRGVYVEDVKQGGWAAVGALRAGDLVIEALGEPVRDVAEFEALMKRVATEKPKSVVLHVIRRIHHVFVELEPDWDGGATPPSSGT
ncbi:MAG: PDZ domain-containing protein [Verrucomicrobiota bacterium]|nr:PDZ domain-containing protein [Verrucomicrobiota bacterium]